MKDWHITPPDWYALPRTERAFMKAHTIASHLIEAMLSHDLGEIAKRDAEIERKRQRNR